MTGESKAPVRFGEVITLTSRVGEWRNKSFTVTHEVHKGAQFCVEGRAIRAITIPDDVKRRFEDGS